MICRRFSKSSTYTSLFPLNLFKDGNVSGYFAFICDFRNRPHTHHFSHSISLKMEMLAVFLLLSVNMTNSEAEQHSIFIHLFI
ncbi:hypothetical protein T4B_12642 [Trichinella pseudospiralis]|uniref:Uncharacterized protein n=2 Tax=Trichinella pseudospiralis TaxID=6337 RepID=A0A0V1GN20_TRIPS|nr:hypothetical protein T4B_12642 [Trichinella pseudospiralis]